MVERVLSRGISSDAAEPNLRFLLFATGLASSKSGMVRYAAESGSKLSYGDIVGVEYDG
jgi:hypothetical protein